MTYSTGIMMQHALISCISKSDYWAGELLYQMYILAAQKLLMDEFVDVCRRQILTSTDGPRNERIKIGMMAEDP